MVLAGAHWGGLPVADCSVGASESEAAARNASNEREFVVMKL